jgi:hypothetical protein
MSVSLEKPGVGCFSSRSHSEVVLFEEAKANLPCPIYPTPSKGYRGTSLIRNGLIRYKRFWKENFFFLKK